MSKGAGYLLASTENATLRQLEAHVQFDGYVTLQWWERVRPGKWEKRKWLQLSPTAVMNLAECFRAEFGMAPARRCCPTCGTATSPVAMPDGTWACGSCSAVIIGQAPLPPEEDPARKCGFCGDYEWLCECPEETP